MKRLFKFSNLYCVNFYILVLILASLVSFAGCNKNQEVKIGGNPPDIFGTDIHGENIRLKQFKGKVIILYFWTNSCCGDKLKQLEPYYIRNKAKGLEILAINVANSNESVESYARDNSISFRLLSDEHSMTSREYGVFGFPTIFIIDREGILRRRIVGYLEPVQLHKYVANYL